MPSIYWESETGSKPAGIYHVEVSSSIEKVGRESGEPYFFLTFIDADDRSKVAHDIVSFSPNAMNMTIAKLKCLGFGKDKTQIEADELVGRRCWISCKVEHQDGYEPRLIVDISAPGFRVGYKSDELDDDIPF